MNFTIFSQSSRVVLVHYPLYFILTRHSLGIYHPYPTDGETQITPELLLQKHQIIFNPTQISILKVTMPALYDLETMLMLLGVMVQTIAITVVVSFVYRSFVNMATEALQQAFRHA